MLENKKNKVINSHLKIFKTYKELNNILPFGYIKTRISPGHKYSIKKQSILINLEKEKNKEISPTKITKNLLYNKNIYIFSEENDTTKKIISKLKKYYSYNKPSKILSLQSESNISNNDQNSFKNSRNISNLNSYMANANTINLKKNNYKIALSENDQNNNEHDINKDEFELYPRKGKIFRSSSINNCIMKNNIYLPSITNRLKNSLPRYLREINGLLVNGLGKRSFKELKTNNSNIDKLLNNYGNELKYTKNKSGLIYLQSYDVKKDILNNINLKKTKKYKSQLYKKFFKMDDSIEITGIKKIRRDKN